jgi:hypothetical protein
MLHLDVPGLQQPVLPWRCLIFSCPFCSLELSDTAACAAPGKLLVYIHQLVLHMGMSGLKQFVLRGRVWCTLCTAVCGSVLPCDVAALQQLLLSLGVSVLQMSVLLLVVFDLLRL